jgi:tetratricopeptide (TPR) repeat protein
VIRGRTIAEQEQVKKYGIETRSMGGAMKQIFSIIVVALVLFCPSPGITAVQEIVSEGSYNMGDGETPSVAEDRALLNAKRTALEQAGTYVESYSKVKNFQLTEDEVKILASGTMEVTVLDKKRTIVGDGFHFWVKIKAVVNPDKMEKMAQSVKEKSVSEDYKMIQRGYEKNQAEMEGLKKELALAQGEPAKKKVEAQIAGGEKRFQANEWFEKGLHQTISNEGDKGIEAYTNAIALDPDYAEAYDKRGIAYYNLGIDTGERGQFELAVKDFRKVVMLKPGGYSAYFAQGAIYTYEEKYDLAIEEMNKAIALDPEAGGAYAGRGFIYTREKSWDMAKAVKDFSKVIAIGGLWSGRAYSNRGAAFFNQKQYDKAMDDFNKAIELSPGNADPYQGRALILLIKRQFSQAIPDLNRAIELNPKKTTLYVIRGMAYSEIGNPRAISDFQKACDMGSEQGCGYLQKALKKS